MMKDLPCSSTPANRSTQAIDVNGYRHGAVEKCNTASSEGDTEPHPSKTLNTGTDHNEISKSSVRDDEDGNDGRTPCASTPRAARGPHKEHTRRGRSKKRTKEPGRTSALRSMLRGFRSLSPPKTRRSPPHAVPDPPARHARKRPARTRRTKLSTTALRLVRSLSPVPFGRGGARETPPAGGDDDRSDSFLVPAGYAWGTQDVRDSTPPPPVVIEEGVASPAALPSTAPEGFIDLQQLVPSPSPPPPSDPHTGYEGVPLPIAPRRTVGWHLLEEDSHDSGHEELLLRRRGDEAQNLGSCFEALDDLQVCERYCEALDAGAWKSGAALHGAHHIRAARHGAAARYPVSTTKREGRPFLSPPPPTAPEGSMEGPAGGWFANVTTGCCAQPSFRAGEVGAPWEKAPERSVVAPASIWLAGQT